MSKDTEPTAINPTKLPDTKAYSGAGFSTRANAVAAAPASESPLSAATVKHNAEILRASLEVSIQSKNEPLALLLKSAIAGINEMLKPQFGDNAIEAAANQDNTPTGTAERIVSLSTGFFDAFRQQHAGENWGDVLTNFMATIRSGFEQGAKEAQDILAGMGVLDGDIASNIDQTLALVRQGYTDFETTQREKFSAVPNPAPSAPV